MPASLQEIAWCVLNGTAEQRRHQRDEWIHSHHWHIRGQLIKAAGSKRTCMHTHRSCKLRQWCPTWHKARGYKQRHQRRRRAWSKSWVLIKWNTGGHRVKYGPRKVTLYNGFCKHQSNMAVTTIFSERPKEAVYNRWEDQGETRMKKWKQHIYAWKISEETLQSVNGGAKRWKVVN